MRTQQRALDNRPNSQWPAGARTPANEVGQNNRVNSKIKRRTIP